MSPCIPVLPEFGFLSVQLLLQSRPYALLKFICICLFVLMDLILTDPFDYLFSHHPLRLKPFRSVSNL
jgi:hypothetical protein